uniref:D-erythronate dehydrogenase n=1 Tax=Orrella sp. TaxID=1921583 RepID=UPI004047F883
MNILITGGAGFLGSKLAKTLLEIGSLSNRPIVSLVLTDRVEQGDPAISRDPRVTTHTGDLLEALPVLFDTPFYPFDVVFHLASAVSGECEADFSLGLRANLATTEHLLEYLRRQTEQHRVVTQLFFASSVAVFGGDSGVPMPAVITDGTLAVPQSSYGIHKFICEQLIADYTRKGFIDGRAARLMTVSVRPGRPNGAASGFLSGMIREPLAGEQTICPVHPQTRVALASPENTIKGILTVMQASRENLQGRTAINLPALTVSIAQMRQALIDIAGTETADLIRFEPDEAIARIVGGWPAQFECTRAAALGLKPDASYDSVIQQYIDSLA